MYREAQTVVPYGNHMILKSRLHCDPGFVTSLLLNLGAVFPDPFLDRQPMLPKPYKSFFVQFWL